MHKILFFIFILLGSVAGVFFALNESIGLKMFQGGIGAVVGAAVGGAITRIGHRRHQPMTYSDEAYGFTAVQEEGVRNYWLDRGRLTASPGLPHLEDNDPHSH